MSLTTTQNLPIELVIKILEYRQQILQHEYRYNAVMNDSRYVRFRMSNGLHPAGIELAEHNQRCIAMAKYYNTMFMTRDIYNLKNHGHPWPERAIIYYGGVRTYEPSLRSNRIRYRTLTGLPEDTD